jgi:hypothetical protein
MEGAPGTLYEGEKFQLLFKFSSRYPFDSPQVIYLAFNFFIVFLDYSKNTKLVIFLVLFGFVQCWGSNPDLHAF